MSKYLNTRTGTNPKGKSGGFRLPRSARSALYAAFCAVLLVVGATAQADVAVDAVTPGTGKSKTPTLTHTCSGSDRLLVVEAAYKGQQEISGITFGGTALTLLTTVDSQDNEPEIEVWYLVNPTTVANDVVVNLSKSLDYAIAAISYTGVDQTTPIDGTGTTAEGKSTEASVIVTSETGDLVTAAAIAKKLLSELVRHSAGWKRSEARVSLVTVPGEARRLVLHPLP